MYKAKQMIVMRRDLKMRKGKIAAQAGHACVEAILLTLARDDRFGDIRVSGDDWIELAPTPVALEDAAFDPETGDITTATTVSPLEAWFAEGVAKICVYVDSEEELLNLHRRAQEAGFISALVRDAGYTEFHGEPTYTCLALEPLYPDQVDPLTGNLPLY